MDFDADIADMEVVPLIPAVWEPGREPIPEGIIGSKVLFFGTERECGDTEGGGLVIDFVRPGSTTPERAVFGFTERGMWLVGRSALRPRPIPDCGS